MAKQRESIGECRCLLCARTVPVHQQINGLAMIYCPFCGNKVQAFGAKADALIRARIIVEQPAPQPKPAASEDVKPKPARAAGTILDL